MTSTKATAADRIAADVRQLTEPIHMAVGQRLVTHDPLLDQLREACQPGGGVPGEARRSTPGSRPPARLDPLDALAFIYVGIAEWRVRLCIGAVPRDADWQKEVLRLLVEKSSKLVPDMAEWLRVEVNEWWRDAAVHSGWNPHDLLKLR